MMALAGVTWALVGVSTVLGLLVGVASWAWLHGRLTLDLGWGRSQHELGPVELTIAAPRDVVYDVVAAPYQGPIPRELRSDLEVLERGTDLVVAAHHTRLRWLVSTTVESVHLDPPKRVTFRLLRGVAPHVEERFDFEETDRDTIFRYRGMLEMDFWILGRMAGRYMVIPIWEGVVRRHMAKVKETAEGRFRRHRSV